MAPAWLVYSRLPIKKLCCLRRKVKADWVRVDIAALLSLTFKGQKLSIKPFKVVR